MAAAPMPPARHPGPGPPAHARRALMEADLRKTAMLDFLLEGPIEALSQATMAFSLMNRSTDTMAPGLRNEAEAEETARCADVPPIPKSHFQRHRELYDKDYRE